MISIQVKIKANSWNWIQANSWDEFPTPPKKIQVNPSAEF